MKFDLVEWINQFPRALGGLIVLLVGLGFLVVLKPPVTLCEVQLVEFYERHEPFMTEQKVGKLKSRSEFADGFENCKTGTNAGACFNFFRALRDYSRDLQTINSQCGTSATKEFADILKTSLELMVELPLEGRTPSQASARGWYTENDLDLFCNLKRESIRLYSNSHWEELQESLLQKVSQKLSTDRARAWSESILSYRCS